MSIEKYKINDDDLDVVTGGLHNSGACSYFLQADGKEYLNKCQNCFYFHPSDNGEDECSNSLVNKK